jgi:mono/diheme cytochrome c family protein
MSARTTSRTSFTSGLLSRPGSVRRLIAGGFGAMLLLLVAVQFVPYGRVHANPPVQAEPKWDSPQTRALFYRACGDCHSNQTVWPWYSNVAPVSWLIAHDTLDGRRKFNVSEWGRPRNKGDEAAKTVRKGEMPPWFYLPIHPTAQLTAAERQALIAGLSATFGAEEGGSATPAPSALAR